MDIKAVEEETLAVSEIRNDRFNGQIISRRSI